MTTQGYSVPRGTREIELDAVDRRLHLRLCIPTEISGVDLDGHDFVEMTQTLVVAPTGAVLQCKRSLGADQELTVRLGNKQMLSRVLGIAGPGESTYLYGISFMQADSRFWGVAFPQRAIPGATAAIALQCGHCGQQRSYVLNEIESLVLKATGSFGLYCSVCKDGMLWRLADTPNGTDGQERNEAGPSSCEPHSIIETPEPKTGVEVLSLATPILTSDTPPRRPNRRRHLRVVTAQAKACIRRPDGEEVAHLLNVSRGGALFRSQSAFPLGAWIRIAAPCTVGADNIFVLARIVRIEGTDLGREYGVQYANGPRR